MDTRGRALRHSKEPEFRNQERNVPLAARKTDAAALCAGMIGYRTADDGKLRGGVVLNKTQIARDGGRVAPEFIMREPRERPVVHAAERGTVLITDGHRKQPA